jgi:hypothetical protein
LIIVVKVKAQGLDVLAGDVGNTYLNANTKEKVYVRCGPEFGPELEGWIAIIKKSLFGLKSSGAQWHAHLLGHYILWGFNPLDSTMICGSCNWGISQVMITYPCMWMISSLLRGIHGYK